VPDRLFPVPPVLSERTWQSILQDALTREGWAYNHVFRMKSAKGRWMTSTTAVGWPDLLAVRGPHILAIEVKAAKGVIGPHQLEWLERFAAIPTGFAWILSPKDSWQEIANWLHDPSKAPKVHGFSPSTALTFTQPPVPIGDHHP
jgi:hypothetical protein